MFVFTSSLCILPVDMFGIMQRISMCARTTRPSTVRHRHQNGANAAPLCPNSSRKSRGVVSKDSKSAEFVEGSISASEWQFPGKQKRARYIHQ